jgi:hypothetical protein
MFSIIIFTVDPGIIQIAAGDCSSRICAQGGKSVAF